MARSVLSDLRGGDKCSRSAGQPALARGLARVVLDGLDPHVNLVEWEDACRTGQT